MSFKIYTSGTIFTVILTYDMKTRKGCGPETEVE
jgi:hypothetical protein